jgi:hypothetical protein
MKRAAGESKGASGWETKARREKQQMLSVEVRDSPLPLLGFIDPGESRSPNRARALRALTVGGRIYH